MGITKESNDDLLTMEALEWLHSINYKDYPHEDRMQLIRTAKILFSEETISEEGIAWLNSREVRYVERNYADRNILLEAAKILYPAEGDDENGEI